MSVWKGGVGVGGQEEERQGSGGLRLPFGPDELHAKGLAARCRGTVPQVPGHAALTFCHLSCGYSPSTSGTSAVAAAGKETLLRAKRRPMIILFRTGMAVLAFK